MRCCCLLQRQSVQPAACLPAASSNAGWTAESKVWPDNPGAVKCGQGNLPGGTLPCQRPLRSWRRRMLPLCYACCSCGRSRLPCLMQGGVANAQYATHAAKQYTLPPAHPLQTPAAPNAGPVPCRLGGRHPCNPPTLPTPAMPVQSRLLLPADLGSALLPALTPHTAWPPASCTAAGAAQPLLPPAPLPASTHSHQGRLGPLAAGVPTAVLVVTSTPSSLNL